MKKKSIQHRVMTEDDRMKTLVRQLDKEMDLSHSGKESAKRNETLYKTILENARLWPRLTLDIYG